MGAEPLAVALLAFVVGALLRHAPSVPPTTATGLHVYVVWVALPALVLLRVPELAAGTEALALVVMPWALLALSAAAVLAVARLRRWPRDVEGALMLLVPLANTSFLGLPLVEAHLGPDAVALALVWDQLGSFLALATYGAFVIASYRGGARPTLRAIALRVVRFPPFIALLVALVLMQTGTPALVEGVLGAIAKTLVPVVMVAVGLQWRARLPRDGWGPAAFALTMRLGVVPLVALGVALALGLSPLVRGTAVLEAGMGPMITAGALAIEAGLAPSTSASVLGWGTISSLLTTAGWALLAR